MKKIIIVLIIIVLAYVVFKANSAKRIPQQPISQYNPPNSAENAPPGSIHNLPVPQAVSNARAALAVRLAIPESKILILEAIETQWPDSCLGIPEHGTVCAQGITPGYNVLMQAHGTEYRYRTNQSGTIIKTENNK